MLKNDIREGTIRKTGYMLLLVAVVVVSCTGMDNLIADMIKRGEPLASVSYADMLLYLFVGEPAAKGFQFFRLPIYWCVYQMIIAATVAGFIRSDLQNYGTMKIIYSGSRFRYTASKLIWVAFHVGYCYLFVYGTIAVYTAARGYRMDFQPNPLIWGYIASATEAVTAGQTLILLVAMPMLVTLTMTYIQVFGELLYGSSFGYFCICVILAISSFWNHPLLLGNYSMTCRSRYLSAGGVSAKGGMIFCSLVCIILFSMITQNIRQFDVLQEQDVL